MAPVLVKKIPFLEYPLDFKKTFRKKRIFGAHKTWRGLIAGILGGIMGVYLQKLLYPYMQSYSLIDYSSVNIFVLGTILGLGALAGDVTESFFKRQNNIQPGQSWIPFDQIDWVLGSLIFISFYMIPAIPSWEIVLTAIVLFGLLHPTVNYLGYLLKLKKNKI